MVTLREARAAIKSIEGAKLIQDRNRIYIIVPDKKLEEMLEGEGDSWMIDVTGMPSKNAVIEEIEFCRR